MKEQRQRIIITCPSCENKIEVNHLPVIPNKLIEEGLVGIESIASVVPAQLRERLQDYTSTESTIMNWRAKNDVQQLLTIADAKPIDGWIDGPPKEPGPCMWLGKTGEYHGCIVDQNAIDYLNRTGECIGHFRIPPPPKQEPVVDCCGPGKTHYKQSGEGSWMLPKDTTGDWTHYLDVTHCQWCGVPLPELEK